MNNFLYIQKKTTVVNSEKFLCSENNLIFQNNMYNLQTVHKNSTNFFLYELPQTTFLHSHKKLFFCLI